MRYDLTTASCSIDSTFYHIAKIRFFIELANIYRKILIKENNVSNYFVYLHHRNFKLKTEKLMKVGIPKEIKNNENRVGMTPAGVAELARRGHEWTRGECAAYGW